MKRKQTNRKWCWALLLSVCLFSCSKYKPEGLIHHLNEDVSYHALANNTMCQYTIQWLPKEYLAATELMKMKNIADGSVIKNKVEEYDKSFYFRLTLEMNSGDNAMLNGLRSTQAYSRKWNYLTYGMTRDLYVLTSSYDTLYPAFYTFQNPYIYNHKLSFLYVFNKSQLEALEGKALTLKYKDHIIAQQTVSFELPDFKNLTTKNYNLTF